jgi:transposase
MFLRGLWVADVAAFFQNDPSTTSRWLRQRTRTGSGLARPRSGRPSALTAERAAPLDAQVAARPDATLAQLCAWWETAFGARLSLSAMSRWLRERGLTRQKRR